MKFACMYYLNLGSIAKAIIQRNGIENKNRTTSTMKPQNHTNITKNKTSM